MKVTAERLLEEQIAVVVVLESGKKDDAMWHVPHHHWVTGTNVSSTSCFVPITGSLVPTSQLRAVLCPSLGHW